MHKNDAPNTVVYKWSSPPNMNYTEACITTQPQRIETPIIVSGWLYKMRQKSMPFTPNWDKRWVVIQNDSISWRHSKSSEVAGSIELTHIENVYKVKTLTKKNKNNKNRSKAGNEVSSAKDESEHNDNVDRVFVISSKKRVLCLMGIKGDNCDKWIRGIQLQLDLRNGGTCSGPKSEKNRRKSNGGGDKYDLMMKTLDKSLKDLSYVCGSITLEKQRMTAHNSLLPNDDLTAKEINEIENENVKSNRSVFESGRFLCFSEIGSPLSQCNKTSKNAIDELLKLQMTDKNSEVETMVFV